MISSFVTVYRDRERECRAHAHLALDPDSSTMEFDELPAERQPQAGPLHLLLRRPHLPELLEDRLLVLRGDADPRCRSLIPPRTRPLALPRPRSGRPPA